MYEIGEIVHNRYEILGVLRWTTVGNLYRAVQPKNGVHVFLWVVGPDLVPTPQAKKRFVEQLSKGYHVRHPHVLSLFDVFQLAGGVAAALEFADGPTLGARFAGKEVDPDESWPIIESLASALSQVHQAGIVLGDLSPELVILSAGGVKLLDLGVAMALPRERMVKALKRRGTWEWMAPELREGFPVDKSADLYSLGAVAHHVLYGVGHPFSDGRRRGLFAKMGRRIRFGPRPRPNAFRWPLVDDVLRLAMSPDPMRRPPDPETFCVVLGQALASSPPRPQPLAAPAPTPAMAARTMEVPAAVAESIGQAAPPPPAAPPPTVMAPAPYTPPPSGQTPVVAAAPPSEQRTVMAGSPSGQMPVVAAAPAAEQRTVMAGSSGQMPVVAAAPPSEQRTMMADIAPPAVAPALRPGPTTTPAGGLPAATPATAPAPTPPPLAPELQFEARTLSVPIDPMKLAEAGIPAAPPHLANQPAAAPAQPAAPNPADFDDPTVMEKVEIPVPSGGIGATRQLDVSEIERLLATPAAKGGPAEEDVDLSEFEDGNRTRQFHTSELNALIEKSRQDDEKKG